MIEGWLAIGWAVFGWIAAAGAVFGIGYQLAVAAAVRRFFSRPSAPLLAEPPAVSLLKPLHGPEPKLRENLASCLAQDYPAPLQMVCGVNTPDDPALAVVAELRAANPGADIAVSPGPAPVLGNAKIANLATMLPLARHEVLVLSDSDIAATPDYLGRIVAALEQPGVGAVSCQFIGRGDAGFWSELSAAMIGFQGTCNMIIAIVHRWAQPCVGPTIAMRRETLAAIGGFAGLGDVLADDFAIGARVIALGQQVHFPPMTVTHACGEASFGELWRHMLRWAVTIREVQRFGHFAMAITQPLPLAVIACAAHPFVGLALIALSLGARLMVVREMRAGARAPCAPIWTIPIIDLFGFAIFLATIVARSVEWRGTRMTVGQRGHILAAEPL